VDGGHQAFVDAETFLEQHMNNRREAVRGAGGVGNDVMLGGSYLSSFTPMTTVRQSPLAGALMMTFLAPAVMWPWLSPRR
jgi:hypothetical protein